jgi:hypothetical protein
LRQLDEINPMVAHPRQACAVLALLPFMLSGMSAIFAGEATPDQPISTNRIAQICLVLCLLSVMLIPAPILFRWDWKAKFFGAALIYSGAMALIGLVPWACILVYSSLPVWSRIIVFLAYAVPIVFWSRRFVILYRNIFQNEKMREIIYSEEEGAVYYLQKGDVWLMEKKFKFKQIPSSYLFLVAVVLSFLCIPFAFALSRSAALPFVHILLTVMSLPIILMGTGLVTRAYLIFYYYPWRIKRATAKDVYVDMSTKGNLRSK